MKSKLEKSTINWVIMVALTHKVITNLVRLWAVSTCMIDMVDDQKTPGKMGMGESS